MPTSRKMDKARIVKYLGGTPEARKFADSIERTLEIDKLFLKCLNGSLRNATRQHEILTKILENCNNLLEVLLPLKVNERDRPVCKDFQTAILIQNSLRLINREQQIKVDTCTDFTNQNENIEEKLCKFREAIEKLLYGNNTSNQLVAYASAPDDYPSAVIESIEKLRDAVFHAADKTKPKPGRKTYQTPEFIRRNGLANSFVLNYLLHFKKLPPISIDGAAYKAFVEFLYAANLSGNLADIGIDHLYKKTINIAKECRKKVAGRNKQT